MLEIRRLTPQDAPALSAIAESVRYRPETADSAAGYLVYVGTPAEYAARLEGNQTSFLALRDGDPIAYLLTTAQAGQTATHAESTAVQERIFGDSTILVDQIGVRPDARGLGAAPLLFETFLREVQPQRLTASIMHGPIRNERSLGFFTGRQGFRCSGEYAEGDGKLWGIYEWRADGSHGNPAFPLGRFLYSGIITEADVDARIQRFRAFPSQLRSLIETITEAQLDAPIRPGAWTARQVLHHIADAATALTERIRLILTEDRPPIKTFEEDLWVQLEDARSAPAEESLRIVDGLYSRLARLLASRPLADFHREMLHPQQGFVKLDRVTSYLDWHGRHHAAQIRAMSR